MDVLEEPTRLIIEAYQRRFGVSLDVPVLDLTFEKRSRFVAALELALQRNMPLFDYELEGFEVSRKRRLWLFLTRRLARLAGQRRPVL